MKIRAWAGMVAAGMLVAVLIAAAAATGVVTTSVTAGDAVDPCYGYGERVASEASVNWASIDLCPASEDDSLYKHCMKRHGLELTPTIWEPVPTRF